MESQESHIRIMCNACLAGKQKRLLLPKRTNLKAAGPLKLVHADICGPINPSTSAGNKYFLLMVDDYSRFMGTYLLKSKDQTLEYFRKFKEEVEQQTCTKIKKMRTDTGGEFTLSEFFRLCSESGIVRHQTAPYTPQQNGVVGRRNKSIFGMVRSMLKVMSLPWYLWDEAVRHTTYLLNRLPTKALKNKTPYEALYGRKPSLEHIRIFGCLANVKVPGDKLAKLDDRSRPLVYLGTEAGSKAGSKAYRCLDPQTMKIIISRDVVFDEAKSWYIREEEKGEHSSHSGHADDENFMSKNGGSTQ